MNFFKLFKKPNIGDKRIRKSRKQFVIEVYSSYPTHNISDARWIDCIDGHGEEIFFATKKEAEDFLKKG